ncbi:MAG: S8 family serine peptidase [Patescibacteria group bacterium]
MQEDHYHYRFAVAALAVVTVFRFLPVFAATEQPVTLAVQFRGADAPMRLTVPAVDADGTLASLADMADVAHAEPLATYQASVLASNDMYFNEQWYLQKISAPTAWEKSVGNMNVIVAVLDTGVDITHPDLRENIWKNPREILDGRDNDGNGLIDDINGWNFYEGNNTVTPTFEAFTEGGINHGTMIAGEIGAIGGNGAGIAGVNWRVSIMPLRVLSSSGVGDVVNVVNGINYAIKNGASVISLSFSGANRSSILDDAIRRAAEAGILVVAAAGNDLTQNGGNDLDVTPLYPACSDGPNGENWVLGVAATDEADKKASFSDFGRTCVDISAPGVRMFSTLVKNDAQPGFDQAYGGYYRGTSLAAPLVAGAAALLKAASPGLTLPQLRDALLNGADGIDPANLAYVGKLGRGRLNVSRAMTLLPSQAAAPVPAPAPGSPEPISTPVVALQALVTANGAGLPPEVTLRSMDGGMLLSFLAYGSTFHGGVTAQFADVDGDGNFEIVTVPGPGGGPHVRVWSLSGKLKDEFFAYETLYRGGLALALADTDGDGVADIITSPTGARAPEVRVFSATGARKANFLAYASTFRGGVRIAAGDVNGDGNADIVTVPASGGGPHVRVFSGMGLAVSSFFADRTDLRTGYLVAVGDVNGDGRDDIGLLDVLNGSHIRFVTIYGTNVGDIEIEGFGQGFQFALGEVDGDGRDDLILGVQPTSRRVIRSYDVIGKLLKETLLGAGTAIGPVGVAPATGFAL